MKVCLACECRFNGRDWCCPKCGKSPKICRGHLAFAPDLAEAAKGFDVRSFGRLVEVEAGNFWFESRNGLLIWALRHYFPDANDFLEIGCGTGFVLAGIQREFPELNLSGSDMFSEALTFAEKRLRDVQLFQMDARWIPFDSEFDVIGAFDVLEHIDEDDGVLRQMFRAVKPSGGIMLTVPQHRFLWTAVDEYSFHKRRYTRKELVEKVERAGFKIMGVSSFCSFVIPLMLLSRLRWRRSKAEWDPWAEFRIGHFLNAGLEMVLGIERSLIKSGLSLPVGGSLVLVARRDRR